MAFPDLGYRRCQDVWLKPVEVHDTTVSGDKIVKIDTFMLLVVQGDTVEFYIHDGTRRGRGPAGGHEDMQNFERYCLIVKHWFYIRPQIRQFQDAVKAWMQDADPTILEYARVNGAPASP